MKKKNYFKNDTMSEVGFEPGPFWWLSMTLTITLTGVCRGGTGVSIDL